MTPEALNSPNPNKNVEFTVLLPSPQSQSLFQRYGSDLPTSLNYFSLMTRGCKPWRPDAVMGTGRGVNNNCPLGFHGQIAALRTLQILKCYSDTFPLSLDKLLPGDKNR
jgi:hypothetical protein